MKKMSKFTDIDQFRSIVKAVISHSCYEGKDPDGQPIYNRNIPKPKVGFTGTVKLHGSNAGIAFNNVDGLWVQSRSNIITPEADNAGCAFFVHARKDIFIGLIKQVAERENIDLSANTVLLYGEWCGGNIQKGVAISGLDKMIVIFDAKVRPFSQTEIDDSTSFYVSSSGLMDNPNLIYNVEQFGTYNLDIDFERPDISQNEMVKLVEAVEAECPAGKFFGKSGIGEGIVWRAEYNGQRFVFKTKGEKHSTSKVKKIAEVDTEKMDSILEFVEYAVTENRLNQGVEQVFTTNGIEADVSKTGDFIRWVIGDVVKEETDVMKDNGLEPSNVNRHVSEKSRKWFMNFVNSQTGL